LLEHPGDCLFRNLERLLFLLRIQFRLGDSAPHQLLIAFLGPTSLLAFVVGRFWKRLEHWPWRTSIQQGLAPISIGLLLAGCFSLAKGAVQGTETAVIAVAVLLILLRCKINPALHVIAGAVGGLAFMPSRGRPQN
jgi:chromate transporter